MKLEGEEYIESARIPVIYEREPRERLEVIAQPQVKWFDHRQVCRHVLRSVETGEIPASLTTCEFYAAGRCGLDRGALKLCAFIDQSDELWAKAEDWRYVEGAGAVHRSLWKSFGIR